MAVDAPVRSEAPSPGERIFPSRQVGYLAGSKALESLDKFITSTESFFHPSNYGLWSLSVRENIVFFFLRANYWLPLVNTIPSFFNRGVLQALARRRAAKL
jgi:hypothetical protein